MYVRVSILLPQDRLKELCASQLPGEAFIDVLGGASASPLEYELARGVTTTLTPEDLAASVETLLLPKFEPKAS